MSLQIPEEEQRQDHREVFYRSRRNRSVLSEGDTKTHSNEEEDHILDADLQEEEDLIKVVRNATTGIYARAYE